LESPIGDVYRYWRCLGNLSQFMTHLVRVTETSDTHSHGIVEALYDSARKGRPVRIRIFRKTVRPTSRQRISRPGVRKPELIKVQSASRDWRDGRASGRVQ
jgi:hypothetical protein